MEKLKSCSFYFVTNFIIRKYFIFIVVAVTFIVNGFFISTANAESITKDYFVISGSDASGDTTSSFSDSEIQKLASVDGNRIQSNGTSWPRIGSYDESKYLEFVFSPDVPVGANIESVKIVNNFRRSGSLTEAKLEVWNGSSFVDQNISKGQNTTTDNNEEIDVTSYINTPELVNGLIVRFLAYRDDGANTKTSHDFIGVIVVYNENSSGGNNNFTEINSNIETDTTWAKENSPYVINSTISVLSGATLFIGEGVVVKFGTGAILEIAGKIEAQGSPSEPIYFTSIKDDSVGGDTNNDLDGSLPGMGDWDYLLINQGDSTSNMNNIVERYSNQGLVLYDGGSVVSDNFNSDNGIIAFGSEGSFSNLTTTFLELYDGSIFNIEQSNIINENEFLVSVYNGSSFNIKNSKIEGNNVYLVNIFKNSAGNFDNVEINNNKTTGTIFAVYDYSSLKTNNGSFSSLNDGFAIFDNSSADFKNINLSCDHDGILVYNNSTLNISDGNISCLNDGISLYSEASANISGVKISDATDAGIIVFNNTTPDTINITKSEITNNNYGFVVFNSDISVHQNSIHDNFTAGAFTFIPIDLDFTSNYWGDSSGPIHLSNPDGVGDEVSDNILFKPFLKSDPLKPHKDPVILIPGITGSYLKRDYGDKSEIWPDVIKMFLSIKDEYLNDLVLNPDGTENIEYPVVPGDIIRGISTVHVFDGLISELENNGGYIEAKDLFVFPYDWRKSTKENSILLKDKIDQIISDTGFDKVDIVAHSMGGLLAKKYILDNGGDKVDQLIFLGTPQLGAPKAFKVLMFGDHMGYEKLFLGLNQLRAKYISQNMPSVYELLPSLKYISLNDNYAINSINKENPINLDYNGTKDFLVNYGRNPLMFPFAEELHNNIDNLNLSSTQSYNFVGCSEPTIGKIKVKQEKSWIGKLFGNKEDYEIGYTDGDETVPLVSSSQTIGSEIYYVNGISHGLLPSAIGVKENIIAILKNEGIIFGDVLKDDNLDCGIKGEVVSTHSPVELHIYDKEGNHTGPNENGDIEYNIKGVKYDVFDDVNYVFLPEGFDYKIVTKATDTGGFNLKIEKQNGEEIINNYDWTLIPLKTLKAIGEIWIGPDYLVTDYKVKMDDNGDGVIDEEYPVSFDGTKLAEESSKSSETRPSIYSSGSIPLFKNNKIIENPFLIKREKTITDNTFKYENINKKEVTSQNTKQDFVKDKEIEKSNLTASAFGAGINTKIIWPIIILVVIALLTIAKIFIKL
jgi:pimeloyl-ACP methyl ester carboxylesterase